MPARLQACGVVLPRRISTSRQGRLRHPAREAQFARLVRRRMAKKYSLHPTCTSIRSRAKSVRAWPPLARRLSRLSPKASPNACSSSVFTPRSVALRSFEPGSAPATTKSVLRLTEEVTRPPAARILCSASSRVIDLERTGQNEALVVQSAARPDAGAGERLDLEMLASAVRPRRGCAVRRSNRGCCERPRRRYRERRASRPRSRIHQRLDRLEAKRQLARGVLANVADTEAVDQAIERAYGASARSRRADSARSCRPSAQARRPVRASGDRGRRVP